LEHLRIKRRAKGGGRLQLRLPRRLGLLGGTTNWSDCLTGLRYLLDVPHLVQGPAIDDYERAFAQQIGVRHAVSFSAGRVGLYGTLRALGIGAGDEVLLQVPTHVVVSNAIRYAGARPVYVDCRLDTYNMDLEQLERSITPRSKAIVLQHTFGIPVDLEEVMTIARGHHLELIEDCVHSLGSTFDGNEVGSFGRAAFFSTEETKTISSTMGGVVATNDDALAERLRSFQADCDWPSGSLVARYVLKLILYQLLTQPNLHRYTRALYEFSGRRNPLPGPTTAEERQGDRPRVYEQRFSNAQAALALRQLRRLDGNVRHRRWITDLYKERLAGLGLPLPTPSPKADPAFVRFPVWVDDRDAVVERVASHAVLGRWFTSVLEEADSPLNNEYEPGSCPRAEAASRHLVNLPTHLRVRPDDVEAIVSALADVSTSSVRPAAEGEPARANTT
jgi:perosamine synthetase